MFTKLEPKLNSIEKKLHSGNTSTVIPSKMSKDRKIHLEVNKKYSNEEFHSLLKADKSYLEKLRAQAKGSSEGGGGGKGKGGGTPKKPQQPFVKITNKDAPATP